MPSNPNTANLIAEGLERDNREQACFARMTEINETARRENRDLTEDEQKEWAEQSAEFRRFRNERGRNAALREMQETIRDSAGVPSMERQRPEALSPEQVREQIGFAAKNLLRARGFDVQQRDVLMTTGASGGYLVGTDMLQTIMAVMPQRELIRPRAMVIPAGEQPNAAFEIPYFDQSSSVAGSVAFAHRRESADMTESDADFGMLRLEPEEQSTYVQIGKKTAVNGAAVALGTFLATFFLREKLATEDYYFLQGTGVNQPLGMLNAPCKVNVDRNTSSQIKFADITSMMVNLLDDNGALWLANKQAMSEIVTIADSAGNNLIYQPGNITQGVPASLFGVPLLTTTNLPNLGSEGDLMLVNPNYYIIKDGRSWELMTYDVRPEKQLLDFVGVWDVDGAPWLRNAVQFKDGNSYSPIVALK